MKMNGECKILSSIWIFLLNKKTEMRSENSLEIILNVSV